MIITINPFVLGVLATIASELLFLIIATIIRINKK